MDMCMHMTDFDSQLLCPGTDVSPQFSIPEGFLSVLLVCLFPSFQPAPQIICYYPEVIVEVVLAISLTEQYLKQAEKLSTLQPDLIHLVPQYLVPLAV